MKSKLLLFLLTAVVLFACKKEESKHNPLVGTWTLESVQETENSQWVEADACAVGQRWIFGNNGNLTINSAGSSCESGTMNGSWSTNDGLSNVVIALDGIGDLLDYDIVSLDENKLVWEYHMGDLDNTMVRQTFTKN